MNLKSLVYSALFATVYLPASAMGDAEPRDSSGRTPLMNLVWKDSATVQQLLKDPEQGVKELRYLLSIGVDPTRKDKHGKTALDIARERKRTDLIPLLEQAMKK